MMIILRALMIHCRVKIHHTIQKMSVKYESYYIPEMFVTVTDRYLHVECSLAILYCIFQNMLIKDMDNNTACSCFLC